MIWAELAKFLVEVGIYVDKESFAKMLAEAIDALITDIRAGLVELNVVDYSYRIAAGVIATNPTMTVKLQAELIRDGIAILMRNPSVKQTQQPMTLNALTALSLLRAGIEMAQVEVT